MQYTGSRGRHADNISPTLANWTVSISMERQDTEIVGPDKIKREENK